MRGEVVEEYLDTKLGVHCCFVLCAGNQADYVEIGACNVTLDVWSQGLVTKLLETTHGQWLYRNVHVHDVITGVEASARNEEIQQFIEGQLELDEEGRDEKDQYLLEVNLEDLESTTGEEQHYWLLQIQAARMERALGGTNSTRRSRRSRGRDRALTLMSLKYHSCIAGNMDF